MTPVAFEDGGTSRSEIITLPGRSNPVQAL